MRNAVGQSAVDDGVPGRDERRPGETRGLSLGLRARIGLGPFFRWVETPRYSGWNALARYGVRCLPVAFAAAAMLFAGSARAQGNYEIQVYGADTVEPKNLMVELHSNFTPEGQKYVIDGVYPTNHRSEESR